MPVLSPSSLTDSELVARLPELVQTERHAIADVIEHLVEMDRRKLYLSCAASSLYRYCIDRLGYDEDAALKRHRVAKLALRLPQILDELRAGTLHLTGLFLLAKYLTADNADPLLREARGKSRRDIEQLIAHWFPRPDVPSSLTLVTEAGVAPSNERTGIGQLALGKAGAKAGALGLHACSGAGKLAGRELALYGGGRSAGRLEPLSPSRVRIEFSARAELLDKLGQARDLLSHAVPSGDLGELFERALDALLERESKRRFGADKPRKARALPSGSRHIAVGIARAVWERDRSQCTYVDSEGRRCAERRFLTLEHRTPFALGGPPTIENLCLLCRAHNLENGRQVFGEAHVQAKIRGRRQQAENHATEIGRPVPSPSQPSPSQPSPSQPSPSQPSPSQPSPSQPLQQRPSPSQPSQPSPSQASPSQPSPSQASPSQPSPSQPSPSQPLQPRPTSAPPSPPPPLEAAAKVQAALCRLGFRRSEVSAALAKALGCAADADVEQLLRACLLLLVPAASQVRSPAQASAKIPPASSSAA